MNEIISELQRRPYRGGSLGADLRLNYTLLRANSMAMCVNNWVSGNAPGDAARANISLCIYTHI